MFVIYLYMYGVADLLNSHPAIVRCALKEQDERG